MIGMMIEFKQHLRGDTVKSALGMALVGLLGVAVTACGSGEGAKQEGDATSTTVDPESATTATATLVPAVSAAPAPSYPLNIRIDKEPTAAQDRIARGALAGMFQEFNELTESNRVTYSVAMLDLNDDGRDDMIVHIQDQQFCGQWGCQGYGILATPTGFASSGVQLGTCFNYAITALPTKTDGMRDLRFDDFQEKTVWDGKKYDGGCAD